MSFCCHALSPFMAILSLHMLLLSFLSLFYRFRPVTAHFWQLFTFHFSSLQRENSRASGALFKQTGGRVVRRGWRHAITNHRLLAIAGTRCVGPRYGGEPGPNGTCCFGLHDNQTATITAVRCGVTADGSWCIEPPGGTIWCVRDGITREKSILVWKITCEANSERMRNEIRKETKDEEVVLW